MRAFSCFQKGEHDHDPTYRDHDSTHLAEPSLGGKMKHSITRSLQFFHRMAWVYKFSLSGIMLVGGLWLHFDGSVGANSSTKAAVFAFFTACILLIDLLPNSEGRTGLLATFITRGTGALLALGAGWHWISFETNGAPWPYMWPVFIFAGFVITGLTYGLQVALLTASPKRVHHEQFSSTIQDALAEEYQRLYRALQDGDTKHGEIAGCIVAMETNLANLILFLRSDPRSGLNQEELGRLLRYADLEHDGEPAGVAARSQHRRLRMIVRGALGESSPDP